MNLKIYVISDLTFLLTYLPSNIYYYTSRNVKKFENVDKLISIMLTFSNNHNMVALFSHQSSQSLASRVNYNAKNYSIKFRLQYATA